ncbi:DUF418 domain-containing protein [Amycolatopsis aidingensis]|uniref:DUF418 domain-containing protein n=1 Tax=Amycolatopsis aidingensis TaxID=2842453 RepID=UPI001C0DE861|nr:DUF418 domain-containing protein [Amycolatopsis aidingensis]
MGTTAPRTPVLPPPTASTGAARALAPDLARGFMLLAIALAHIPLFVSNPGMGSKPLNEAGEFLLTLLVSNEARPLFVFLFGYGLAQLMRGRQQRGDDWTSIRKLLRRRGFWLFAIGLVHAVVIAPIDILTVYGLAAMLVAGMVRAKDSTLLWAAGVSFIPATAVTAWLLRSELSGTAAEVGGSGFAASMSADPFANMLTRLEMAPMGTPMTLAMVLPGVLFGIWAARRRFLDEPAAHYPLLGRAAVLLIGLSLAGKLPAALMASGVWTTPSETAVLIASVAHPLTGYLGGIGLAALIGLVAVRLGRTRGPVTTAIEALGQRSMTFYIFQSFVALTLFYPFTLGLTDDMGLAGAIGVAIATWLVSLILAEAMRRANYRGPFETLLRRLSYRQGARHH